jgi:glycosyltransferase involved in cell wall biosynthesis
MPNVSVIIPTYNEADLLEKTINSVLLQTYRDFEVLVLDDGRRDKTEDVVRRFADSRIRYIKHEVNIGFTANWTYGIRSARGQYFSILGHDDLYLPDFISNRMKEFGIHPDVLAVTGSFDCCNLNGAIVRPSRHPIEANAILSGEDLINLTLGFTGEWFNGATLYKTSVIQPLWNKILTAGTAVDVNMHIHLALMPDAKIAYLSPSDMLLRIHPGQESISNTLYLSECGAMLAMQLWHFTVKPGHRYVRQFRKRFASDINHYARLLWDRKAVEESRSMFRQALVINPFSFVTWLKYIRSFFVNRH